MSEHEYNQLKSLHPQTPSLLHAIRMKIAESREMGEWDDYIFWRSKYEELHEQHVRYFETTAMR